MRRKAILAAAFTLALGSRDAAATPADDLAKERRGLEEALAIDDPAAQTQALAAVLGEATDGEVRRYAHRALAQAYGRTLAAGKPAAPDVEERLLAKDTPPEALVAACYGLTTQRGTGAFIERCLAALPAEPADPGLLAERARLAGTVAFGKKDAAGADRGLSAAAAMITVEQDPVMHLRLAQARRALGKAEPACAEAKGVYRVAPLLTGAREALDSCGDGAATVAKVTEEMKQALLATERQGDKPAPVLSLDDDKGLPLDIDPAKLGKVTVLVFFSTWCPHCGLELPRVVAFAKEAAHSPALAAKVTVLGVRTALEREHEKYEAFARRMGINFKVGTDATMSIAFAGFVKALGRDAALPTIAVLDGHGVVRFVLEPGDYKDTAKELLWAVQALVP